MRNKKIPLMIAVWVVALAGALAPVFTLSNPASHPRGDEYTDIGDVDVNHGRSHRDKHKKVVGYYTQWGIYARDYHVKNIHKSGSADTLTHIMYAFGNVADGQCKIGDAYADYDKFYSAEDSVDGVADSWEEGALRGNFGQLKRLKEMYPHLKIVWSFGGWTWSPGFSQAAENPEAFAESCYQLVNDERWAGVFDGIDIDWEYPNECGLACDDSGYESFTDLMRAVREQFGSQLVTAAISAGEAKLNAADYVGAANYVDFYMLMAYDFFTAANREGPIAPHSALYKYPGIPNDKYYADYAVQLLKDKGINDEKILLGVGFYGRGWSGVVDPIPGSGALAAAKGKYEAGVNDYKELKETCPTTGVVGGTAYAFCDGEWWSYDTPVTVGWKMDYIRKQELGGVFFWELSGDTKEGELIEAIHDGLGRHHKNKFN